MFAHDVIMTEELNEKQFPSIEEAEPTEEGGAIARSGFNYQDEVAVSFLIEMLEDPLLLAVHCETHDDIVLKWEVSGSASRIAEFVQVKGGELNKLWSVADLCSQKKAVSDTDGSQESDGKPRKSGSRKITQPTQDKKVSKVGNSILETSFARDAHLEESSFRLVTLRDAIKELEFLKYPRGAGSRSQTNPEFEALATELEKRFPNLKSPKGNGLPFWLERCLWDVRNDLKAVQNSNLVRLLKLAIKDGHPLLPEHGEVVLEDLRHLAKAAGSARWKPDPRKKKISRADLRKWWMARIRACTEGASAPTGGKLRQKMTEAGLSDDMVNLALELRRRYASEMRTPRYMDSEGTDKVQDRVLSAIVSLRADSVAGQSTIDGATFHARCLARMEEVSKEVATHRGDPSAILKGCMYDVSDRCLLRFTRQG